MINAAYDIHDDDPAFGYRLIADEAALHGDTRTYNQPLTALRAPTERAHALLGHWRALDRVTLCPWRISVIAAALVLTSMQRGRW